MKHFRSITALAILAGLVSCSKDLSIKPLDFSVTSDATTYNVRDTVHFSFTGNAEFISFYSGEPGHDYEFRNRTTIDGIPQLEFTSYAQFGTQQNTLQLLVSNDFKGVYNTTEIPLATWTDITSRATLSTGTDNTPSGIVDLSDFLAQKKPIYLAYKFTGVTGSTQKTWTIKDVNLNLLIQGNTKLPITDLANAGWKQVSLLNPSAVWTISATQLRVAGGNAASADNEDWVISKLLYLNTVSPDVAAPIKNITENSNSFDYVFSTPGTYKVVFLAANATADKQESTTKEIVLTVN